MAQDEYRPWDADTPPDEFEAAMGDKSLSNPAVVSDLVASFCYEVKGLMDQFAAGTIGNDELASKIKARCRRLSDMFEGKVPGWNITKWHTARLNGLRSRATALLHSVKVNYDNDANFDHEHPVAGLFYLLSMHCIKAYEKSHGEDEPPENHSLSRAMRYITNTLLGVPRSDC